MEPTYGNGKICYIEMPSVDLKQSAEFYCKVFGWRAAGAGRLKRRV